MTRPNSVEAGRLSRLYELSMGLFGEPKDVLVDVLRMIGEVFGPKVIRLSAVRGAELHFLGIYLNGAASVSSGRSPLRLDPCATVLQSGEITVYDRVTERFPEADFLREHHAQCYCGIPSLTRAGEVAAITCLLDDRPREFSTEDLQILRVIAQRIGREIERMPPSHRIQPFCSAAEHGEQRLRLHADVERWPLRLDAVQDRVGAIRSTHLCDKDIELINRHAPKGARVLVVDDHALDREGLVDLTGSFGWQVRTADSGESAVAEVRLHFAQHLPFDVVLIDCKMPGVAGLQASKLIRALPEGQDLPILLMVGRAPLEDEEAKLTVLNEGGSALKWLRERPNQTDIVLMDLEMPGMDGCEATRLILGDARPEGLPVTALTAGALNSQREAAEPAPMIAGIPKILDAPNTRENQAPTDTALTRPALPGIDVRRALCNWGSEEAYRRYLGKFVTYHGSAGQQIMSLIARELHAEVSALAHKLKGAAGNLALFDVARAVSELDQRLQGPAEPGALLRQGMVLAEALAVAFDSIERFTRHAKEVDPEAASPGRCHE